ncbi:uncharacterized protein LOC110862616 isoform X4 [Folsomia candida]|uniref:uncharacterized protein LOC110862616 isoform X4 n=1 Tax=Folsomia candida TaxID=158441 RepID=UPI001604ADFD|nr:uncharacterized protein LOC110862616 isoform X4 [Folsomia candida]
MKSSIIGSFLLILLVVSCATAEKVDQTSEIESRIVAENGASNGDKFHKKRSITNIMKLLLGGNVPPNHPLVKESEPKSWNLAPQILASLPGSGYGLGGGWGPTPAQKLQQIFETKAKILPYTGQVASGLIGIGGVKGEILKQIHGLSTSVIANVAAEAAQKAVRTALAAQAVTNQVAHATPHILNAAGQAIHSAKAAKGELLRPLIPHANGYANFGVGLGHHHDLHQGWHSTQQNSFALPNSGSAGDKTPGDLPGPPYSSQSVQTQLYQAPAYQNSYSAAASAVPSTSSPDYGQAAMYNMQQNGQQQESASEPQQTQDYNELVNQITNDARNRLNAIDYSTLAQQLQLQQQQQQRPGQNYGPPKPQVQFRTSLGGNIQEMFRKLHPFFRASPKSPRPAYPHTSHSAPLPTFPPPPQGNPQQSQATPLYPDLPQHQQASQVNTNQVPINWGDSQVAPITPNPPNQFDTTKPKVPISTLQALLAVPNMSPTMLQSILLKLSETHQMPTDYMMHRSSSDPIYYDDQQQQYSPDTMTLGSDPALDLLVDSVLSQPDHMLTKRHALLEPEEQFTLTPVRRQETLLVHPEPILVPSPKLPLSQLVDRLRTFLVRRPTSHRLPQGDSDTHHPERTENNQPTVLVGTEVLI